MTPDGTPFGPLRYLYVGCPDVATALDHFSRMGAKVVWDKTGFGARVAAVRLGAGPLLLLADHRPASSMLLCFEVKDLKETVRRIEAAGWRTKGDEFEIPNGPCRHVVDPGGLEYAIFENHRPNPFGGERD